MQNPKKIGRSRLAQLLAITGGVMILAAVSTAYAKGVTNCCNSAPTPDGKSILTACSEGDCSSNQCCTGGSGTNREGDFVVWARCTSCP